MRLLIHDPDGYACNMGWTVQNEHGITLYRGPEWAARLRVEIPSTDLQTGLLPIEGRFPNIK